MNCNFCRHELSQCLDGRLPSGRRTSALAHAESCKSCGEFWTAIQAAQKMTASLRKSEVSAEFRDGLWERIRAGEGTPDAVFPAPVAALAKVRYTLIGAAAAAGLLIGASTLQNNTPMPSSRIPSSQSDVASVDELSRAREPRIDQPISASTTRLQERITPPTYTQNALFSNARPLTLQVLAREAASQLEQHYEEAAVGMRMMRDPTHNRAAAMRQVIHNANEVRDFGELLIDLNRRDRLVFTDDQLDRDLNFAVEWLDRVPKLSDHSPEAVDTYYGPALSKQRLSNVTDHIGLRLASDPARELHELMELNTRRPGVFPKLFIVFGDMSDIQGGITNPSPNMLFVDGSCGPNLVAPRSEVTRHEAMLRVFGDEGQVRFQLEVRQGR